MANAAWFDDGLEKFLANNFTRLADDAIFKLEFKKTLKALSNKTIR